MKFQLEAEICILSAGGGREAKNGSITDKNCQNSFEYTFTHPPAPFFRKSCKLNTFRGNLNTFRSLCRCFCSFFSKTRIHHKQVNNMQTMQINTKYQMPNLKYTTPKEQTYHSKYQIHFPKYQNRPTKIQHQCIQNTKFSHLKPILGCEIHLRDGVLAKLHNRQRSFYWRTRTNVRIGE